MEQSWLRYYVVCKNQICGSDIPIPYSILLEERPLDVITNPDAGSENVACPKCRYVFYYSPADRKWYYDDIRSFQDLALARRIGIVNFGCPEERGEGLVEILLPLSVLQGREYVSQVSEQWKIGEAYCKCGKHRNHRIQAMPGREHYSIAFSPP